MGAISWILMGLALGALNRGLGRGLRKVDRMLDGGPSRQPPPRPVSAESESWPGMPYLVWGASGFVGGWWLTSFGIGSVASFGWSNLINLSAAAISAVFLPWFVRGLWWLSRSLVNDILELFGPLEVDDTPATWQSRPSNDLARKSARPAGSPGVRPQAPPPPMAPPPVPPPSPPPASPADRDDPADDRDVAG